MPGLEWFTKTPLDPWMGWNCLQWRTSVLFVNLWWPQKMPTRCDESIFNFLLEDMLREFYFRITWKLVSSSIEGTLNENRHIQQRLGANVSTACKWTPEYHFSTRQCSSTQGSNYKTVSSTCPSRFTAMVASFSRPITYRTCMRNHRF